MERELVNESLFLKNILDATVYTNPVALKNTKLLECLSENYQTYVQNALPYFPKKDKLKESINNLPDKDDKSAWKAILKERNKAKKQKDK